MLSDIIKSMRNATDIANAFLMLSEPEAGDVVTNLKLQKLLYYAQGFHLALYGRPFFSQEILAWEHGPVVREVYNTYRDYGSTPLSPTENNIELNTEEKDFIKQIWNIFGQFSAWRLRDMTHSEDPWKNTPRNQEITHSSLLEFFKTQVTQ